MTFQTFQKKVNNRGKKLSEELKRALCSIWLGMRDSNYQIVELGLYH